jgi:hypothetical protein
MFTEHRIPRRPPTPPRPAWMDTDVVDPAWVKAHTGPYFPRAEDHAYAMDVIEAGLDKAITMTFHPEPKQKLVRIPSDELVEARGILGDAIMELLPIKGAKQTRTVVDEAIATFLTALETIVKDAQHEALEERELIDGQDVISGAWQMIHDGHNDAAHITNDMLIEAAEAQMDERELEELRDNLTDHLKYRS